VDCQLDLVGGEAKGQPARVTYWERGTEFSEKGVEVWLESGCGGGSIGDMEGD